jgi:hypothetical protein
MLLKEDNVRIPSFRSALLIAAVGLMSGLSALAWAEESASPAALASALASAPATLEAGLKVSEVAGIPISAKFEIEDGKLQLSVYTLKDADFAEVVADPKTGAVVKTEKITDGEDLKAASAQNAAMAKAKLSLLAAADTAVKANPGFRAVSIYPQLQGGNAVAEVTLLQGVNFKKVTQTLN